MPRKKAEENVACEATIPTEQVTSADDFRQAMINLGLQICKDYDNGRLRPEAPLLTALTELFKAVKE